MRSRVEDLRARAWLAYSRRRVGAHRFGRLGKGSTFQQPATIISPHRVFIGENTFFHSGAWISVWEEHHGRRFTPTLTFGDRCLITRDLWVSCVGEITIGDEVTIGDRCVITDSYHEYEDPDTNIARQPMAPPRPVSIGDGVFINPGVVITAGVTIGARSFIAANSVVTKDVEPNTVVAGNPAKPIRRYDRATATWTDV